MNAVVALVASQESTFLCLSKQVASSSRPDQLSASANVEKTAETASKRRGIRIFVSLWNQIAQPSGAFTTGTQAARKPAMCRHDRQLIELTELHMLRRRPTEFERKDFLHLA